MTTGLALILVGSGFFAGFWWTSGKGFVSAYTKYLADKVELERKETYYSHGGFDIEVENRTGYAINLEIDENVVYLLDVEGELD